jgi:hypothetical protein
MLSIESAKLIDYTLIGLKTKEQLTDSKTSAIESFRWTDCIRSMLRHDAGFALEGIEAKMEALSDESPSKGMKVNFRSF